MPDFKFDIETHTYTVDGIVIPSVTQILSTEGLISPHGSEWHMTRGRYLHSAIKLYLEGNLDEESLDSQLRSYLEGFKKFMNESKFEVQGSEVPIYHTEYLYSGMPDLWGVLENQTIVIDIKTGSPERWHILQLAAYYKLLKDTGTEIKGGANLYLDEDGDYNLKPLTVRGLMSGVSVFLSALVLYNFKRG